MGIIYAIGLVLAVIIGGAIVWSLRAGYAGRIASEAGEYEKDAAESRKFYADVAKFPQINRGYPGDDRASAA
ncbi:MAG TPA: hypothetical protein VKV33_03735 [Streptosporangiaceae bacterium]|jgi:hypothetical protein|nr:hypothetical protein [Streptosporangiaceae bacterium]